MKKATENEEGQRDLLNNESRLQIELNSNLSKFIDNLIETSELVYFYSTTPLTFYDYFVNRMKQTTNKDLDSNHNSVIKWITSIDRYTSNKLLNILSEKKLQIRHSCDTLPINFIMTNNVLIWGKDIIDDRDIKLDDLVLSKEQSLCSHYTYIFEMMWMESITADERLKNIQKETALSTRIIFDSQESLRLIYKLFFSTKKEALIVVPSINGFFRMEMAGSLKAIDKLGFMGVDIKILTVSDNENLDEISRIKSKYFNIKFRDLQAYSQSLNRIMIFDRKRTIIWELKDDSQINYIDAFGMAFFIESSTTAESYAAIFYSFWRQSQMYKNLLSLNNQLQKREEMQSKFLDLVAHEIRTPLQSILGLTEIAKEKVNDIDQKELLYLVYHNAKKLHILTENILDMNKIDNKMLYLNKELFNINTLIKNIIKKNEYDIKKGKELDIHFDSSKEYFIFADKKRLEKVIYNLIDNSAKSILKKGIITITLSKKIVHKKNILVINVMDNGTFLESAVLSKLFTKFDSGSYYGAGLGLFICKSVVELHGGRIWARNNKNNKGTTFSFGIPIDDTIK